MTPFFKTQYGELYNCDCMEYMQACSENQFDICFTDPPYGMGISNKEIIGSKKGKSIAECNKYEKKQWDKKLSKNYIDLILKISKNQLIFGGNYYSNWLPSSSCWLVWNKLINNKNFADCELIWTSFNTADGVVFFKKTCAIKKSAFILPKNHSILSVQ